MRQRRTIRLWLFVASLSLLVAAGVISFGRFLVVGSAGGSSSAGSQHSSLTAIQHSTLGRGISAGELIVEPEMGLRPLTRILDRAQSSIYVEMYILTDLSIRRTLERAATQGVGVYVLLERHALGMGTQPERVANELRAAGVHVRWTSGAFALTHAKLVVLDNRIAVISTANFSRSAFTRNREFLLVVRGKREVHQVSSIFRADWDGAPAWIADENVVVSPQNSRADLVSLLSRARVSVRIYAEEVADPRLERLLMRLARKHVCVKILLAAGQTPAAAAHLLPAGVLVRSLAAPYIHAKAIVVDSRLAFLGSENLSTQSLDLNREVGLIVRGGLIVRVDRLFDRDWARTSRS